MTQLLQQVFSEISVLKESDQDFIASIIRDEIIKDRMWEKSFMNSQDLLSSLAEEAINEFKSEKTKPLSF